METKTTKNKATAIQEILEMGNAAFTEVMKNIQSKDLCYYTFESEHVKRLVNARWMLTHPEDHITTNCTDPDDYYDANYAHSWAVRLGEFDPNDQYKISDAESILWKQEWLAKNNCTCQTAATCAWKDEFRKRVDEIVSEIINCPDIRIYMITHFHAL